jgi:hypothetical protein
MAGISRILGKLRPEMADCLTWNVSTKYIINLWAKGDLEAEISLDNDYRKTCSLSFMTFDDK